MFVMNVRAIQCLRGEAVFLCHPHFQASGSTVSPLPCTLQSPHKPRSLLTDRAPLPSSPPAQGAQVHTWGEELRLSGADLGAGWPSDRDPRQAVTTYHVGVSPRQGRHCLYHCLPWAMQVLYCIPGQISRQSLRTTLSHPHSHTHLHSHAHPIHTRSHTHSHIVTFTQEHARADSAL